MPNKLLITFDSLRYDVFASADLPFLKGLGDWKRAWTQATYTFPAHMSFFVGKLPQTLDASDHYDPVAIRFGPDGKRRRSQDLWRLTNPEAPRAARDAIEGANIVEGLRNQGWFTAGTGSVNWFNPALPAGRLLTEPFEAFRFFDGPRFASHHSAPQQVEWLEDTIARARREDAGRPIFAFVNFGETHARFVHTGCDWYDAPNPYGDREACLTRQRRCLEHLDAYAARVFEALGDCDAVLCADHGEALGEDGLWGHGFHHEKVMEVPMLIRLSARS